jgi:hypothetical protein
LSWWGVGQVFGAAACCADDIDERCGRAAEQARQVVAVAFQVAVGDGGIQGGDELGAARVQACCLQRGGVFLDRQVAVGHRCTGDLADDLGQSGQVEGRPAELVAAVAGSLGDQQQSVDACERNRQDLREGVVGQKP